MSDPLDYKDLMIAFKEADLRGFYEAIETGIEYAKMSLVEHDSNFGRGTIKNRNWAEMMERDIGRMRESLEVLEGRLP